METNDSELPVKMSPERQAEKPKVQNYASQSKPEYFHLVFRTSLSFPQVKRWLMPWHRCSSSATSVSAGFNNLQAGEMPTSAR